MVQYGWLKSERRGYGELDTCCLSSAWRPAKQRELQSCGKHVAGTTPEGVASAYEEQNRECAYMKSGWPICASIPSTRIQGRGPHKHSTVLRVSQRAPHKLTLWHLRHSLRPQLWLGGGGGGGAAEGSSRHLKISQLNCRSFLPRHLFLEQMMLTDLDSDIVCFGETWLHASATHDTPAHKRLYSLSQRQAKWYSWRPSRIRTISSSHHPTSGPRMSRH